MNPPGPVLRVAALISGEGTTLEHLLQASAAGRLHAQVVGVVCSRPDAGGIERARRHGVPVRVVSRQSAESQRAFNDAVHQALAEFRADLLVLAGFLSKLELRGYAGRAMNVHPALIPAFCGKGFYGRRVHAEVLASGVKVTGATVHFCDDEYDTGPIILQQAVPVEDGDSVDALAARVQAAERELYVRAIELYAQGRLRVEGRRVLIRP